MPFFSVAGAQFVESLVGVGAARVRDLFAKVRAVAPAIVFIDEVDAAGRRRGSGGVGGGAEERDQTLNQLLVEMDGFEVSSGIVVLAATNRPDILAPALLRPGRFDRHITVDRPDVERREAIPRLHARTRPLSAGVDFAALARQTPGFTGADLANVVNEAALLSIRAGKSDIDGASLSEAVQRVISGPQRRGHLLSDTERLRVAYHEAGHAVVAAAVGRGADVLRVSIVARGRALGAWGCSGRKTPSSSPKDRDGAAPSSPNIGRHSTTSSSGCGRRKPLRGRSWLRCSRRRLRRDSTRHEHDRFEIGGILQPPNGCFMLRSR